MPCGIPMDAFREACGESMPLREAQETVLKSESATILLEALRTFKINMQKNGKQKKLKLASLRRALEILSVQEY